MSEVEQFMGITGCDAETAKEHLEAANGNLELAMSSFFEIQAAAGGEQHDMDQEEDQAMSSANTMSNEPAVDSSYTGPRTLDGKPAPAMAASSSAAPSASSKSYVLILWQVGKAMVNAIAAGKRRRLVYPV